jgi:hypothetical protein
MNKEYKIAWEEIKDLLEDACLIKAPIADYVEFLEEVSSYVEVSLEAAEADLARIEDDDNG